MLHEFACHPCAEKRKKIGPIFRFSANKTVGCSTEKIGGGPPLRRGHASLLCIVPILVYVLREQYYIDETTANTGLFLHFLLK